MCLSLNHRLRSSFVLSDVQIDRKVTSEHIELPGKRRLPQESQLSQQMSVEKREMSLIVLSTTLLIGPFDSSVSSRKRPLLRVKEVMSEGKVTCLGHVCTHDSLLSPVSRKQLHCIAHTHLDLNPAIVKGTKLFHPSSTLPPPHSSSSLSSILSFLSKIIKFRAI